MLKVYQTEAHDGIGVSLGDKTSFFRNPHWDLTEQRSQLLAKLQEYFDTLIPPLQTTLYAFYRETGVILHKHDGRDLKHSIDYLAWWIYDFFKNHNLVSELQAYHVHDPILKPKGSGENGFWIRQDAINILAMSMLAKILYPLQVALSYHTEAASYTIDEEEEALFTLLTPLLFQTDLSSTYKKIVESTDQVCAGFLGKRNYWTKGHARQVLDGVGITYEDFRHLSLSDIVLKRIAHYPQYGPKPILYAYMFRQIDMKSRLKAYAEDLKDDDA